MFMDPPMLGRAGPGLEVPDEAGPTVTGPSCAPAAYALMKITASSSRKPHSFAAGLTGSSPSSLSLARGYPLMFTCAAEMTPQAPIILPGDMIWHSGTLTEDEPARGHT